MTVIGYVPDGVDAAALMISVVEHGPTQSAGSNDAVAPVGSPETENAMDGVDPSTGVTVMVLEPDDPGTTLTGPVLDSA